MILLIWLLMVLIAVSFEFTLFQNMSFFRALLSKSLRTFSRESRNKLTVHSFLLFPPFQDAVSCEISRIFSQMLFIDGSFHGDPVSLLKLRRDLWSGKTHPANICISSTPHSTPATFSSDLYRTPHAVHHDPSTISKLSYSTTDYGLTFRTHYERITHDYG